MNSDMHNEYPYGEFPYKYTVSGQEQLRKEWKERMYSEPTPNIPEQQTSTVSTQSTQSVNQQNSGLGLNNLLPLLTKMKSGGMDTKDMMSMFSPMLKSPLPLKELMDAFGGANLKQTKSQPPSEIKNLKSNIDIDKLKKI